MDIKTYLEGGSWPIPTELEAFQFPAGEWSVRGTETVPARSHVMVVVCGTDSDDIMAAGVIIRWAKRAGHRASLLLPYLPAARSDHDAVMGVTTYADVVRSFGADAIVAIDPHSPIACEAYGPSVHLIDHTPFVVSQARIWAGNDLAGIIAADKSGSMHAQRAADALGVPMFQALKVRDPQTGRLSHFECEDLPTEGKLLVVDDICDGGGTFVGLASVAEVPAERLGLWVTHGVFSGTALETLPKHFGLIACTDSVRSVRDDNVVCIPLLTTLYQRACA